jgi:hypothetical protein
MGPSLLPDVLDIRVGGNGMTWLGENRGCSFGRGVSRRTIRPCKRVGMSTLSTIFTVGKRAGTLDKKLITITQLE